MPIDSSDTSSQAPAITARDTVIPTLGECRIPSPLGTTRYIPDDAGVLVYISRENFRLHKGRPVALEEAGPRERIYFDPSKTKCAIVTCGGLCPGLNDVIRSLVLAAHHNYHVAATLGIRYGLEGFIPKYGHDVLELTPEKVSHIHEFGGTILASSRGPQPADEIVDALERMNINILFCIGGDGTMRAAQKIVSEIKKRGRKIAVIGVPKTIDNDINLVATSFGFDTAVEKATEAIRCAHTEAIGAPNSIGMVKVMGRESGFIAAQATLASKEVNFVLVPEDPFELEGDTGLLTALECRLQNRGHAVIVVAEGAGQHLLETSGVTDASGNPILGDIAGHLIVQIKHRFKEKGLQYTLKHIDPSYIIRSVPANSNDRVYCGFLGLNAVHAAMAGKTGMVVSRWNERYVHIPLPLVTLKRKKIDIASNFWRAVLETTGQHQCPLPTTAPVGL